LIGRLTYWEDSDSDSDSDSTMKVMNLRSSLAE
jgi:hypothetical protein